MPVTAGFIILRRLPFISGDDDVTVGCSKKSSMARKLPGVAVEVHSGKVVSCTDAVDELRKMVPWETLI